MDKRRAAAKRKISQLENDAEKQVAEVEDKVRAGGGGGGKWMWL
jgi:hypothetical protein